MRQLLENPAELDFKLFQHYSRLGFQLLKELLLHNITSLLGISVFFLACFYYIYNEYREESNMRMNYDQRLFQMFEKKKESRRLLNQIKEGIKERSFDKNLFSFFRQQIWHIMRIPCEYIYENSVKILMWVVYLVALSIICHLFEWFTEPTFNLPIFEIEVVATVVVLILGVEKSFMMVGMSSLLCILSILLTKFDYFWPFLNFIFSLQVQQNIESSYSPSNHVKSSSSETNDEEEITKYKIRLFFGVCLVCFVLYELSGVLGFKIVLFFPLILVMVRIILSKAEKKKKFRKVLNNLLWFGFLPINMFVQWLVSPLMFWLLLSVNLASMSYEMVGNSGFSSLDLTYRIFIFANLEVIFLVLYFIFGE